MLTLTNPSSTDLTEDVYILTTDLSALGKYSSLSLLNLYNIYVSGQGIDYHSGPYTTTFLAGTTAATFDVFISNDDIYRGARRFQLSISPLSLPNNATIGDIDETTVTIVDDDCKYILLYF